MAKQAYTQEALDILLKKNIAMDYIDAISSQGNDLADVDALRSLLDRNHSELSFIDCDSIY